jgi:hypothetical protein
MAENPLDANDEKDEQQHGEADAFEQHRAEGRREHLLEGLNCGADHVLFQPLRSRI